MRHIERTTSLLLLLDVSGFSENSPEEEYKTLIKELGLFSAKMLMKKRVVALTKLDTVTEFKQIDKLQQKLESAGESVFRVSSVSGEGIKELLIFLADIVRAGRQSDHQSSGNWNLDSTFTNKIWED